MQLFLIYTTWNIQFSKLYIQSVYYDKFLSLSRFFYYTNPYSKKFSRARELHLKEEQFQSLRYNPLCNEVCKNRLDLFYIPYIKPTSL